jgi:hypothetical protein
MEKSHSSVRAPCLQTNWKYNDESFYCGIALKGGARVSSLVLLLPVYILQEALTIPALFFFSFYLDGLGPLACYPSELFWNHESYSHLVGLLGGVISSSRGRELLRPTSIYLWLYSPFLGLGRFFSFFIFYTEVRIPWTEDQPTNTE